MPELAKHIKIEGIQGKAELTIDGEPFQWYIAENGIRTESGTVPTVTLTILAEKVEFSNSLLARPKGRE